MPSLLGWVVVGSLTAGLLVVTEGATAPAARASVANCDGGTITTRESAFAFVANHSDDFVGLGDALNRVQECGYGGIDGLRASLVTNNDTSLRAAGLLPAVQTDINGMAVSPGFLTFLGGDSPPTVIGSAMWDLQQSYELTPDHGDGADATKVRQDMRDLMRAQARASGDWKLDLFYQVPTGLPGKTATDKSSMTMDAADFKDWASVSKLSAAYDQAAANGTVQKDLQDLVLATVQKHWVGATSREVVSDRIAGQVKDARFATWLNARPAGMYSLVARDQLQTMMYGLGVLDQALGRDASTDAQQTLLANSTAIVLNTTYAAASGKAPAGVAALSDTATATGMTDVINLMKGLKGAGALADAIKDAVNLSDKAASAEAARALRTVTGLTADGSVPDRATLNSKLLAAGMPTVEAGKYATFFTDAGRAGIFKLVKDLAQFGAAVAAITQGKTTSAQDRLAVARGALALASTAEPFVALTQTLRSGWDRNTIAALGLNTDFAKIWGSSGTVGSTVKTGTNAGDVPDQIANQIRALGSTGSLPGMTPEQYAKAIAEANNAADLRFARLGLGTAPGAAGSLKVANSVVKLFGQSTSVAGSVLDIVTSAMTLADSSSSAGAKAAAGLTLVSGVASGAASFLGAANGIRALPFAVGAWALGLNIIAAVVTIIAVIIAWLVGQQAAIDKDRDVAYQQWLRWDGLGILRPDWAAKYDYAMYSLAPDAVEYDQLGYGKRDAPKGYSYFAYQKSEFDHFASTYDRAAETYWPYLEADLHKDCTASFCAAPSGPSGGGIQKVMVVGDSISAGYEGDYTWRYRLWQGVGVLDEGRVVQRDTPVS